ncbi:MAG: TolC family protein, partial [Verrucomicrobia bacterium]|nr:TolC family protein [Verrucomicrobiota bacterium]
MMKKKLITHAPKVRAKTRIIAALALPFLITAGCITNEGRNIGEHPSDLGALNSITIGDATEDMALPDIEQNPSISNYVKYALLNNPGIRSAFKEFRAQIQRISQAESLPDPRITYGYFLSSVETRVGPQEHRLSLSQMFPWWGKLELSAEVEKRIAFVKYEEFRAARLDLVNRVKNSYYDLYFTRRKTNIIEENIQLLKGYLSSVLAKYESGSAEYSDVLKVQLEIDNLKDALISNRELISPLVARFNSMLNLEPGAEVALPELIDYGTLSDEKPALLNTVLTENPAILKTEYLTEKDKASLALANKEFYPDITAAIDYTVVGEPRMTGVTDA